MNEGMELAWHSGHTRQGAFSSLSVEARPGLTWSPGCQLIQGLSTTHCFHPPPAVTPGSLSGFARGGPGTGYRGGSAHCSHLAQMREHCPAATHHGMEVQLFSSSP